MVKKILKFGGTSVGTIERIQHIAKIIKKEQSMGNKVVAVVSAMAGKTNELIKLSKEVSEEFSKREYDVLLSSGEQVTCALLAGSLKNINYLKSISKIECPLIFLNSFNFSYISFVEETLCSKSFSSISLLGFALSIRIILFSQFPSGFISKNFSISSISLSSS